jgi:hypothetical protein
MCKYVGNPDTNAIAGILRYPGIALQCGGSSLVSFRDKSEVECVRTKFLKGKLGPTNPDAELDAATQPVNEKMPTVRRAGSRSTAFSSITLEGSRGSLERSRT